MVLDHNTYELVELFVNGELQGDQLVAFQQRLASDPDFAREVEIFGEIEEALGESDVMELRSNLQNIAAEDYKQDLSEQELEDTFFGLAEEIENINDFDIEEDEIYGIGNSLQKLHLQNHQKSVNETVHQVYKENADDVNFDADAELLSEEDELLFNEIELAVGEKDVIELRSSLETIAKHMPLHNHSVEDIEEFLDGELSADDRINFEADVEANPDLAFDLNLYKEINEAIGEEDVMELRHNLAMISENETSHSRSVDEIEEYLSSELTEENLASFEEELIVNPDLVAEVQLYKEIDEAVAEEDIMQLRASLESIKIEEEHSRNKEKRGVVLPNAQKVVWYTVAASIMLILGIASFIRNQSFSSEELYRNYYQTYDAGTVFRSANSTEDILINQAMEAFNEKDYSEALNLYTKVLAEDETNPVGNFYAGMALQEEQRFEEAINSYQKVVTHADNLFVEQAEWYIGLCYLQREERDKAVRQFRKIVAAKGYYGNMAEELLRKLD